jgi:heme/copper-type cytochrome/quinol oxidase subunit 2
VIFIILFIAVDVYISYKMVSFASLLKIREAGGDVTDEKATGGNTVTESIKLFASSMITTPYYIFKHLVSLQVYGYALSENILLIRSAVLHDPREPNTIITVGKISSIGGMV